MVLEWLVVQFSLGVNRLTGQNNIAKHGRNSVAGRNREGWKGQDIGWLVLAAPLRVQFPDRLIIGEKKRSLGRRYSHLNLRRRCFHAAPSQFHQFSLLW